ncbi:ATP-dependent helicase [Salmonella enterica subsp. enterica]|nr:ATP-dependent helicase [Salmonella enterica subsp. enterica]
MTDDFAADGQLAKAITGFKPREPQRQMAVAVTQAIENAQPLVVEAGTGTGKTYAYLAPALRAGKKVIISTGSKALQDQLYSRDLPTVAKALAFTGKTALLKGRSNYLCLERLEQQALAGRRFTGTNVKRRDIAALLVKSDAGWRYQHLRQRGGGFPGLAVGHQYQRQLPWQRLPALQRVLCGESA